MDVSKQNTSSILFLFFKLTNIHFYDTDVPQDGSGGEGGQWSGRIGKFVRGDLK